MTTFPYERVDVNGDNITILAEYNGCLIGYNNQEYRVYAYCQDIAQYQIAPSSCARYPDLVPEKPPLPAVAETWGTLPTYMRDAIVAMNGKKISAVKVLRSYFKETGSEDFATLPYCKQIVEYAETNFHNPGY
jgi:hypothetical protein